MANRDTGRPTPPTPSRPAPASARGAARLVAALLVVAVAGVALLGLDETASIRGLAGLLGSRSATVGLLAGHWQNDSGATCPDGLTEAEINLAVARAVAYTLRQNGIDVQVLPEYGAQLNGFRAQAFVAIHADSCVDLSGFKIARMTHSDDPEAEDRLVEILYRTYGDATGLAPHRDTITDDMREYHALRRISPSTPGAIIEIGFMGGDRYLLTNEQDLVAVGIANGIMTFLDEPGSAAAGE